MWITNHRGISRSRVDPRWAVTLWPTHQDRFLKWFIAGDIQLVEYTLGAMDGWNEDQVRIVYTHESDRRVTKGVYINTDDFYYYMQSYLPENYLHIGAIDG